MVLSPFIQLIAPLLMYIAFFATSIHADDSAALKEGEALYQKCISCHGGDGLGRKSQQAPMLAGQDSDYVQKQINDIVSGKRKNSNTDRMMPYVKNLSPTDIGKLALYIQSMKKKQ
jgi:cytochrome c553